MVLKTDWDSRQTEPSAACAMAVDVRHVPGLRAQDAQERLRVHGARTHLNIHGLLKSGSLDPPSNRQFQIRSCNVQHGPQFSYDPRGSQLFFQVTLQPGRSLIGPRRPFTPPRPTSAAAAPRVAHGRAAVATAGAACRAIASGWNVGEHQIRAARSRRLEKELRSGGSYEN